MVCEKIGTAAQTPPCREDAGVPEGGNKKSKLARKEKILAFVFILPALFGFTVFTLISIVISAGYSFTNFNPVSGVMDFVLFDNYAALFNNPVYSDAFVDSIVNTLFLVISVPLGIVLAMIIAGFMSFKGLKGNGFFRAVIYLPAVTSAIAVNYIWRYMFQEDYGLINSLLQVDIPWLSDDTLVKVAIIIKNVWAGLGAQVILFIAGMQNISSDYYEAADLDGASSACKFFRITVPLLTPVLFYTIITGLIGTLQAYTDVQLFAAGQYGSRTIVYFIWLRGIGQNRYGLASAASIILAVSIMLITVLQFKFSKWVVYSE